MSNDNPYQSPESFGSATKPSILPWTIGAVFVCGAIGAGAGAASGAALGTWVPNYYRSVFLRGDSPDFDPVSVGIGTGLSQGAVFGTVVGLILVAMFYWNRLRLATKPSGNP